MLRIQDIVPLPDNGGGGREDGQRRLGGINAAFTAVGRIDLKPDIALLL
jgi:hypothetical protein